MAVTLENAMALVVVILVVADNIAFLKSKYIEIKSIDLIWEVLTGRSIF